MIKFADIRDSLVDLIKERAGLNLKVYFNHVLDAGEDYVFVRLRPSRTDLAWGFFDRSVRVDFQIHLHPDGFGIQRHTDYYDIIDRLDVATLHSVKIAERNLPVYEASAIIFDDILTYSFKLDFCDYWNEVEANELMRHLHLDLNER